MKKIFVLMCAFNAFSSAQSTFKTLFLTSEIEGSRISRVISDHSFVKNAFDLLEKELTKDLGGCRVDFYVSPSRKKGDGLIIDVSSDKLQLTWDDEDSYDYAPRPGAPGKDYAIVRRSHKGGILDRTSFHFVIVSKEVAKQLASLLIGKGETVDAIKQQVSIDGSEIEKLMELASFQQF